MLGGDGVLRVGTFDLGLDGLLGALFVAFDLLVGQVVLLLERLARFACLVSHCLGDLAGRHMRGDVRCGCRDVLDPVDRLAQLLHLGVDDGLDVDLDVAVRIGHRGRLRNF
ncbi:hypothetical protein [Ornithinimicrobium kibberense]|uniref:hypothetical protein n=1 Tax=Ornithinimicrobium kibberense TaxID=282060 RepID=UPI00361FA605